MIRGWGWILVLAFLVGCGPAPGAGEALGGSASWAGLVGSLPVQHAGRIKPLDTFARHLVLGLGGRSRLPDGREAAEWLVDAWAGRDAAWDLPVVRIRNPELAAALGLPERSPMRYSIRACAGALERQSALVEAVAGGAARSDPVHRQVGDLAQAITAALAAGDPFAEVPLVPGPEGAREAWVGLGRFAADGTPPDAVQRPVVEAWAGLLDALHRDDLAEGRIRHAALVAALGPSVDRTALEWERRYHRWDLFTWAIAAHLGAVVLLAAGLVGWGRPRPWRIGRLLIAGGVAAVVLGVGMQAAAVAIRCGILGRMPVSTLYESIVFVALMLGVAALAVEARRRDGGLALAGAGAAALLLLVSRAYASDGDTLGMLQAVLNSNMWLGIHVLTITAGYALCLVAALVGHLVLWRAVRAGRHDPGTDRLILGTTLSALLLTLVGTMLGGVWADQSWGRFWGWDPKENGALLIVLWIVMLVHLRISGSCGPLGFAYGLCLLSIVVMMAWFGVNLLGVGLHSYGFDARAAGGLLAYTVAQAALATALWWVARRRAAATAGGR